MRLLPAKRSRGDAGFSLVETLIALLVLSLAGVAIINGLQTMTKVNAKSNSRANAQALLTAGAEVMAAMPFEACRTDGKNPYSAEGNAAGIGLPTGVTVDYIEALGRNAAGANWQRCFTSANSTETSTGGNWVGATTEAVQRITLRVSLPGMAPLLRRVTKNSDGGVQLRNDNSGTGSYAVQFVDPIRTTTVTSANFKGSATSTTCGASSVIGLRVSNVPSSHSVNYWIESAIPVGIDASISGGSLTVWAKSSFSAAASLTIGAYDSTAFRLATSSVLTLTPFAPVPSMTTKSVGAVASYDYLASGRTPISLDANLSGTASTYYLSTGGSARADIVNNTSLRLRTTSTASESVTVNLSGNGFVNPQGCTGAVNLVVKPRLDFTWSKGTPTTYCDAFKTSTSSRTCDITITPRSTTGSLSTGLCGTGDCTYTWDTVTGTTATGATSTSTGAAFTVKLYKSGTNPICSASDAVGTSKTIRIGISDANWQGSGAYSVQSSTSGASVTITC